MNRRTVIQSLGLITGHSLFPSVLSNFLASCGQIDKDTYVPSFFNQDQMDLVTRIIDVLVPATKSPSASEAKTQFFLDQVFRACMTDEQKKLMKKGLDDLNPGFDKAADKTQFLSGIDQRAFAGNEEMAWFRTLKQFTLIGFFTSKEGTTIASNYVKVPDEYKGEIPADEKTLNYGKTNLHFSI